MLFFYCSLTTVYFSVVVPQSYSVNVMDEHVLRGNAGIVKCHIPSFVIDFVFVSGWILDDGNEVTEIYAEQNGIELTGIGTEYFKFTQFFIKLENVFFIRSSV